MFQFKLLFLGTLLLSVYLPLNSYATPSNDEVSISENSNVEIIGPEGLTTSCFKIAELDQQSFWASTSGGGVLYDGLGNKKQQFQSNDKLFNVKLINWTPEIVDFLKRTVDDCVSNRNSDLLRRILLGNNSQGLNMSPSRVKGLFDEILKVSQTTNNIQNQIISTQKIYEENKEKERAKLAEHIRQIKNGSVPINSVLDAAYYYSAKSLESIIASPMLTPDNGFYTGVVVLDFQEEKNLLRGKIENLISVVNGIPNVIPVAYVFLVINKNSISFNPELMRIGQPIKVVGKYNGNGKYGTVGGEVKAAPILQVLYMGNPFTP